MSQRWPGVNQGTCDRVARSRRVAAPQTADQINKAGGAVQLRRSARPDQPASREDLRE